MAKKKTRIMRKPRQQAESASENNLGEDTPSEALDEEAPFPQNTAEGSPEKTVGEPLEDAPESGEAPVNESSSLDEEPQFDPEGDLEENPERAELGLVGEGVDVDESEVEDTESYLKGLVEALIFSSDKPQSSKEIARAAKIDRGRAQELIEQLLVDTRDRGVRLVEVAEGYAFRTNPTYSRYVREYLAQRPVRLSRAQLETLAIVAYRQPITRPEVDDIRGVDSGAVLKLLLERELIRILGKKDEPGRPMIYGTAPAFLDLFSLNSLRDLPTLREFTELSEDSRAKFEMEIGEPAPEGPIDLTENDDESVPFHDGGSNEENEKNVETESSVHDAEMEDPQSEPSTSNTEAQSEDYEGDTLLNSEDEAEFPDDEDEDDTLLNPEDEAEFPDDDDDDEDEDEGDEDEENSV